MPRFITFTTYDNEDVRALSEAEFWETEANDTDMDEYIWQEAPDAETAIAQHFAKHDEWNADVRAGRPEKHTY